MKGNKKILVAAILLLLIAVSFGTYAIYRSSITGDAEVEAAVWDVTFEDGSSQTIQTIALTFGSSDCATGANAHVAPGKIAPGVTCSKQIVVNAGDSEVDVTYEAEVDDTNMTAANGNTNLTSYLADANPFTVTVTDGGTGVIAWDAQTRTATLTVSIAWDDEDDDAEPNDSDTALAGATITVPVTLTAKQYLGN